MPNMSAHALTTSRFRPRITRSHVFALLSGGIVLGLGASATLASWNDSEWVFGGVDSSVSGVVASTFEVQQNRGSGWGDFETSPGGALTFVAPTSGLTPGDAAYTQVSLRTAAGSIAGDLSLQGGTAAPTPAFAASDSGLWAALRLRVVVTTGTPGACDAAAFGSGATYVIGSFATATSLDAAGTITRSIAADGGTQQNYCFQLLLPLTAPDALQGTGVSPVWEFRAASV
jgi:predicted ribosomally synthesized peptide with SipW-like signal peptide